MLSWHDIDAVVFDMDGLVLDTERTYREAWQAALNALDYGCSETLLDSLSGLSMDGVLSAIADFCGSAFDQGAFMRISADYWRGYVAENGIEVKYGFDVLRDYLLRERIPFCLATNSEGSNARECLRLAGLDGVFKHVIARDQVARGKPAPDLFLRAAEVLGVPVARCLVLEDSAAGVAAAVEAGALPVMVPSAWPVSAATRAGCRLVLNDLAELLASVQSPSLSV